MSIPKDLKYTKEHEWARVEGDLVTVGITDYAQHKLGDIVYVELPSVDSEVTASEPFGTIESVKAASDLYSPVSGKVVEIHEELMDDPKPINQDPYGEGWMIRVEGSGGLDGLLDPDAYEKWVEEEESQ
ncbi:MAG: glycine cleavage system protein GcvH [Deltaproteobacteria bacterium]|nr:glycine cleavage system protein GcvH [Deltaproteobacteria bacterium]MBW2121732.1 glycine cleavage system protein GcvH [Deltaproteobacteria bacterium]